MFQSGGSRVGCLVMCMCRHHDACDSCSWPPPMYTALVPPGVPATPPGTHQQVPPPPPCISYALDEGIRLSVGTYCWTFHRSADKLRPCPSYSRRRDRINLVPNHLEERLLDQAQARASYTPLFWGHSRSIPQGMILDVQPLVKSLFCPVRPSPNGFFDFEASTP